MKHSFLKRVERLENHPRWRPPPPPSAEDLRFRERANDLVRQIDEKYARLIREGCAGEPTQWSGLTLAFLRCVRDHIREDRPLAFPPAVAEAYLGNPYAGAAAACQDCRYKLPVGYFQQCPVCGGQVDP